jgi:hypothetical protein
MLHVQSTTLLNGINIYENWKKFIFSNRSSTPPHTFWVAGTRKVGTLPVFPTVEPIFIMLNDGKKV